VVLIRVLLLAAVPLILQSGYLVPGSRDISLYQISLEICGAIRFHEVGGDGGREHFQSVVLGSTKGSRALPVESLCN
jgi:hypothetical protein